MKNKATMFELAMNVIIFALAVALIVGIMIKTATINYQNSIKAKAIAQLNSITAILETNQGGLKDFYEIHDSRIHFDINNQNCDEDCYYYIEINGNYPDYQLAACDRNANVLIEVTYEVAYEN